MFPAEDRFDESVKGILGYGETAKISHSTVGLRKIVGAKSAPHGKAAKFYKEGFILRILWLEKRDRPKRIRSFLIDIYEAFFSPLLTVPSHKGKSTFLR